MSVLPKGHLMHSLKSKRSLPYYKSMEGRYLGDGCYSTVKELPGGKVLKTSHVYNGRADGAWEYLAACYKLGEQRYSWMPKVHDMGVSANGMLWAVMDKYEHANSDHAAVSKSREGRYASCEEDLMMFMGADKFRSMVAWFRRTFWDCPGDLHSGNYMFDLKSRQWVVTDPFGGHRPAAGLRRQTNQAQWKRNHRSIQ